MYTSGRRKNPRQSTTAGGNEVKTSTFTSITQKGNPCESEKQGLVWQQDPKKFLAGHRKRSSSAKSYTGGALRRSPAEDVQNKNEYKKKTPEIPYQTR